MGNFSVASANASDLWGVDQPGHVPADLAVGLRVPDCPAQRIVRDLRGPAGQVPRQRPQACADLSGGQVPQRPPADLGQQRGQRIPVHLLCAFRPARKPILQPVAGSRFDCVGPGRAQPRVQLLALLLQRINDVLLSPAADLVPPAPAIRPETLAQDTAPAAPALPVIPAVSARPAF